MSIGRNNRVFFQKPSAKTILKISHQNALIEEVVKPRCTLAVSRWVQNTPWVTLSLCHCSAENLYQEHQFIQEKILYLEFFPKEAAHFTKSQFETLCREVLERVKLAFEQFTGFVISCIPKNENLKRVVVKVSVKLK
jgi:hypothetical protein